MSQSTAQDFLDTFGRLDESSKEFLTSMNVDTFHNTTFGGVVESDIPDMIYLLTTFPNYFSNIEIKIKFIKK